MGGSASTPALRSHHHQQNQNKKKKNIAPLTGNVRFDSSNSNEGDDGEGESAGGSLGSGWLSRTASCVAIAGLELRGEGVGVWRTSSGGVAFDGAGRSDDDDDSDNGQARRGSGAGRGGVTDGSAWWR